MIEGARIAVLGGDEREHHIAELLTVDGALVTTYASSADDQPRTYQVASSAEEAVRGVQWLVCPSPGLETGDIVFSPGHARPIALDAELLSHADLARGGLILGRSTESLNRLAAELGFEVYEMKADSALAVANATSMAEAALALLIESTNRLLREHVFVVIGFGNTGMAITQCLLAMRCDVIVAARSKRDRERARQLGAHPVAFEDRCEHFRDADIVINTVPDPSAVPNSVGPEDTHATFFDIASPPGGMDHQTLLGQGLDVSWTRALAGMRAPLTTAEHQYSYVTTVVKAQNERLSRTETT